MFVAGDEAYIALADYHNGALRFRAGQFVVLTEPGFLDVLARDEMAGALQRIDRAAFLGESASMAVAEPATAAEQAADQEPEPVDEPAPEPNTTIAAGKPRGNNRMSTGTHSQSRRR